MPTITIDELPGPHGVPVLGNLLDIDRHSPIEGVMKMVREYGPAFKMRLGGDTRVFISGADIVAELCDDSRFDKQIGSSLQSHRPTPTDGGLVTTTTDDPRWRRAHNILMAPFSQQAMREYMPRMLDIAEQLVDKWSRLNPDDEVNVTQDMTALTLDTIALCGFDYRFNSFYRDTPHPFVAAMVRSLLERQKESRELPIQRKLRIQARRQQREDQEFMANLVKGLVADRRRRGESADNTDLLGRMLVGVDRQSGETLTDENIIAQCITFLIAGHETTSGLLSFATYYLLKNPEYAARARAEVDQVLGDDAEPDYEQVRQLTYVRQVLDESLRLWPTVPMFTRTPLQDTVVVDKYDFPKGSALSVVVPMLHRDTSVWGDDAEEFDPDHFAPERIKLVPPTAYRPFGTGLRACIGRQFALQEATLVLGMLLQRFELVDHRDYQFHLRATLTIKPDEFWIQVRPRTDRAAPRRGTQHEAAAAATAVKPDGESDSAPGPSASAHGTPLLVLFGSNLGTAEGIANKLGREGTERGFRVTVGALDDHLDDLPNAGAALVVCSSYNGEPPENAVNTVGHLKSAGGLPSDALRNMSYSVFGCGDTDWAATYQAVPTELDAELERHGARRVHPRGAGNAHADFDGEYRAWHDTVWTDLSSALGLPVDAAPKADTGPRLSISMVNKQLTNPVVQSYDALPAQVLANVELTADGTPGVRSTRHVEVRLPAGVHYRSGDHLGVLPRNSLQLIRRVMNRFDLDAGMYLTIVATSGVHTHLPLDEPAPLLGILGTCVELQATATRADIETMARYTEDPAQQADMLALVGDDDEAHARFRQQVREPNVSVLDLLERFDACTLPFAVYLDMLPALQPRYYSISSSPLVSAEVATVTDGVLRAPARRGNGEFAGICSTYLADMAPGSTVFVFRREPTIPFRPPADPSVPMIMVGAGTGLAPFRGFLQERAAQKQRGSALAPSLLFFGCRTREHDRLYADELRAFEQSADVRVFTAFSREPTEGRKYAQHEMLAHADDIWDLVQRGATIYVCGNAHTLAPGVRAALTQIATDKTGGTADEAAAWLADLRAEHRYLEDIWGSN